MADDARDTTEIRTFLIADVRGYTHYTQEHGDEAAAHLAARFADIVGEMVAGRDGRIVELRGDEALCVFGSPRGALRAAVDLQRRCADELRADPSVPLRVGIGIDAGEAVAVAGGYRGGALNLAARLCSIAGPGEVLVSEGIVHLARHVDEMSYVDRGRVELKGLDEPVHVMQVTFELDMPEAASVPVRRWTQRRLAAMAVGGIVLVALAVLVATRLGAGHPASLGTNVVGILDSSGRIVGQVPLRGRPGGVAAGRGSVWATDTERDVVVRLDSADRQVVDTIPTGHDPTGVAVGGGGVWVANSGAGTVSWINSAALATAHDSRAFGVVALTDSRVLWAAVSFAPGTMVLAWPRGRVRFTSADDGNACVEAGDERWRLDRILPTKAVDELLDQLSNCGSVGEAVSVAAK